MFKSKLNKRTSLNLGGAFCLIIAVYFICYLLLHDHILPISINSMLSCLNHLGHHWRILAVGLLPVYVALMIFGTAVIGIYFGSAVHRWITYLFEK